MKGLRADRVHHVHGSGVGATFSLVAAPTRVRLETEAVVRIGTSRQQVFVRTRFTESDRGQLGLLPPR